jgi:tetratricopeptide (TPR) repeat protein
MTRKVWVRTIALAAVAIFLIPPGFGQSRSGSTGTPPAGGGSTGTGTTGTGTGTGTVGRPTTTTPTNPNNTQQNPQTTIQQPIFLSGRIALEDGTAPPEPVVIQTVCNGTPHAEGYTDAKGYFAVELGSNRGIIQDASEFSNTNTMPPFAGGATTPTSNNLSRMGNSIDTPERKYMGCDLQAKLAGFRSQTVALAGRRPMDDPNIGTILLHRLARQEEGRTVSAASLAAPKDAKKAYEKGMDALKKKKLEDAQKNFEKAVETYPQYAEAWFELGRLRAVENKPDLARGSFDQAIKADPKYVPPYLSIAILDLQEKKWQELADVTEKTVKLDPFSFPQAYFFNSVANFNLHKLDIAEKSALECERLDTRQQFPKVRHLLGLVLADRKDWAGAAQRFHEYLRLAPKADDTAEVQKQLTQVEAIQAQLAAAKDK